MNRKWVQVITSAAGALEQRGKNAVGIDVECMRSNEHLVRNLAIEN